MKKLVFILLAIISSSYVAAETVHCDSLYISDVWVEGDRDDDHVFQNKLVVKVSDGSSSYQCGGKIYLHLENTSPAFSGMLSVALSALATNKEIEIAINTSNATTYSNQLAFIRIKQ